MEVRRSAKNNKDITKKKGNTALKIVIAVLLIAVVSISSFGFIFYNDYKKMKSAVEIETIYNNISVNNVNIGGLSKEEALKALNEQTEKVLEENKITVTNGEKRFDFNFNQFEAKYNLEKAVDEAYNYARDGSVRERYNLIQNILNNGKNIEAEYSYNSEIVTNKIKELENEFYVEPKNATMKKTNGNFVIEKGVNGIKLNVEETSKAVCTLLDSKTGGEVQVITEQAEPKYNEDSFANAKSVIGTFSTNYSGGGGRVTNMEIAASKINGTVLYPGDVFSTNDCFGPSTAENGYKPAPTIIGGKLVDDLGGGVCQVSSTLYNAILLAELDIVERQNHSLKVGYCDYGFDATLAGDYIDLKFKNSTDAPLYMESHLTNNQVVVTIYGHEIHSPTRKITFENALVETVQPPAESITYDSSLPEGTRKVTVNPLKGYKYKLYKLVYEDGKLIEKVEVNSSYYRPRRAEVTVGSKKAEVKTEPKTDEAKTTESVAESEAQVSEE